MQVLLLATAPLVKYEVRKKAMGLKQRRRWPSIAPRFFVASDSVICALAFAHARQGRSKVIQEVLRQHSTTKRRIGVATGCDELLCYSNL